MDDDEPSSDEDAPISDEGLSLDDEDTAEDGMRDELLDAALDEDDGAAEADDEASTCDDDGAVLEEDGGAPASAAWQCQVLVSHTWFDAHSASEAHFGSPMQPAVAAALRSVTTRNRACDMSRA